MDRRFKYTFIFAEEIEIVIIENSFRNAWSKLQNENSSLNSIIPDMYELREDNTELKKIEEI